MSDKEENVPLNSTPTAPAGAHQAFLGLSGVGFLVLVAGLLCYGVYGERITAGLDRACAEAALDAARKMEANGNLRGAIQKYRQAWEGHIGDEQERLRCGLAIADVLYREGRYNEAQDAYEALPEAAFESAGAYAGYVSTLWELGSEEEAARLSKPWLALAEEEGNVEQQVWAHRSLMRSAEARGELDAAMAHCRAVMAVDPGGRGAIDLARLMAQSGDTAGAIRELDAFLAICEDPARKDAARGLRDNLSARLEKASS